MKNRLFVEKHYRFKKTFGRKKEGMEKKTTSYK